ncbi:unnamed protein product [Peronospora destructor]|uniref:Uncharacterized protein n=1 Tax=Peronospora destructor TaxID=86335 RepID=A0AAV0TNW2_9STRA|nr:unnamed protein product [Peronospora destructor]
MSGIVTSSGSTVAQFTFPQLRSDTVITHRFEVINDCTDAMIVGWDLMNALGLILDFKKKLIKWDDCQLQLNTEQSTTLAEVDEQHDHEFPKSKGRFRHRSLSRITGTDEHARRKSTAAIPIVASAVP